MTEILLKNLRNDGKSYRYKVISYIVSNFIVCHRHYNQAV